MYSNTMTLTQNPFADMMRMWGGVRDVRVAQATMQSQNITGVGKLLSHFGVTGEGLERLGMNPVNAKAVLGAEGWRGSLNVSKNFSQTFGGASSTMLESLRNGWGSFEQQMPQLSKAASGAANACKSAATGLAGRCGGILQAAKGGSGIFGGIFNAVKSVAGPLLKPLAKIGSFMRMIPGLNIIFAATDVFKAVKTLFDPSKPWSEKLANLGKAALSVGAALPIPGASLLGGARGVWAVGDAASSLMKR